MLKMAENSLFAILLRSSWWISFAIAAAVVFGSFALLPAAYAVYGAVGALPFAVIGTIAASRQWRAPSAAQVAGTVERVQNPAADLQATKGWRNVLVCARRWKVARTGVEPLRDLHAARLGFEATECVYVTTGEVSDNARRFATEHKIRLIEGPELAAMLPRVRQAGSGTPSSSRPVARSGR